MYCRLPDKLNTIEDNLEEMDLPLRWNNRTKHLFTELVNSNITENKVVTVETLLESNENTCIDETISKVNEIYTMKGLWNKKRKKKTSKVSKKWYDFTCLEMGKRLKLLGKLCERDPKNNKKRLQKVGQTQATPMESHHDQSLREIRGL